MRGKWFEVVDEGMRGWGREGRGAGVWDRGEEVLRVWERGKGEGSRKREEKKGDVSRRIWGLEKGSGEGGRGKEGKQGGGGNV